MADIKRGFDPSQVSNHGTFFDAQAHGGQHRHEPPIVGQNYGHQSQVNQPQPQPQYAQPQYAQPQHHEHRAQASAHANYVHPAHGGPSALQMHQQGGGANHYGQAPSSSQGAPHGQTGSNSAIPKFARIGSAVNYAGAALSLSLVVGLGVWGYNLAMRDVTGIPVVRALEGPMRVQPDNPGGQLASHQGFSVNEVQSDGQAAGASDRLVLAPAPEGLNDDDLIPQVVSFQPDISVEQDGAMTQDAATVDPVAAALALADRIAANSVALQNTPDVVSGMNQTMSHILPASVPGVSRSLRPAFRPADLDTRIIVASAATDAMVADIAPEKIAAGTRLVQLGAFDSAEVARKEWVRLSTQFEAYLGDKSRVVQRAQSGGKTFYRLRAMGFTDLADARRFCSVLMAAKAACIPVVTR